MINRREALLATAAVVGTLAIGATLKANNSHWPIAPIDLRYDRIKNRWTTYINETDDRFYIDIPQSWIDQKRWDILGKVIGDMKHLVPDMVYEEEYTKEIVREICNRKLRNIQIFVPKDTKLLTFQHDGNIKLNEIVNNKMKWTC
jgi:hypothetical protein